MVQQERTQARPPSSAIPHSHLPFVVCGKLQHNGTREKFRICESARANRFIEEAIYFQVETYTRTADLDTMVFFDPKCSRS